MSLNISGFTEPLTEKEITLTISNNHPLVKLGNKLPWQAMLDVIMANLQKTQKHKYWRGRPIYIRTHLGAYLLQQQFDLTDR